MAMAKWAAAVDFGHKARLLPRPVTKCGPARTRWGQEAPDPDLLRAERHRNS